MNNGLHMGSDCAIFAAHLNWKEIDEPKNSEKKLSGEKSSN